MEKKPVKRTRTELVELGQYLNTLRDSSNTIFEVEDAKRMKECSWDDVILRFQNFFDGKTDRFKLWITQQNHESISLQKYEFEIKAKLK